MLGGGGAIIKRSLLYLINYHHLSMGISTDESLVWLKVLTNEKREGLAVVSFDRLGFKLFSL